MFKLKFLDGSPVDEAYANAVSSLVSGAAAATEFKLTHTNQERPSSAVPLLSGDKIE